MVASTAGGAAAPPAERAARGAALLDDRKPGWFRVVIRSTISVASLTDCPLGQVYGFWTWGLRELGFDGLEGDRRAPDYGFNLYPAEELTQGHPELDSAWRNEVTTRQRRVAAGRRG